MDEVDEVDDESKVAARSINLREPQHTLAHTPRSGTCSTVSWKIRRIQISSSTIFSGDTSTHSWLFFAIVMLVFIPVPIAVHGRNSGLPR